MAKNKRPNTIWMCRDLAGEVYDIEVYPVESEGCILGWGYTWSPSDDAIQLCRGVVDQFLGEELPPHPLLAEVSMCDFRIVKIWESMEEDDGE